MGPYFQKRNFLFWKITANPILSHFLFGTAYIIHQISLLSNSFFRTLYNASVHSPSGSVACLFRQWVCITVYFWELTFNPSHVFYIKIYHILFPLFSVSSFDTIPIHLTQKSGYHYCLEFRGGREEHWGWGCLEPVITCWEHWELWLNGPTTYSSITDWVHLECIHNMGFIWNHQ